MRKALWIYFFAIALILSLPGTACAHGVKVDYSMKSAVEITASYDTGDPMSEGQVAVYAPDDPATPFTTGKCDEQGRFVFTPDPSKPGIWDVQVRLAGHGGVAHISVGEEGAAAAGSTGYKPLQIILMAACVIWGFIGTALFFKRRNA